MKRSLLALALVVLTSISLTCALTPRPASALSMALPSPDLNFAKGKHPQWAPSVLRVLREPQAHYLGGLISYWPPNWWTILDYDGDTAALNSLLSTLTATKGLQVAVSFRSSTAPNAAPGSWTVEYSQVTPDKLFLYINLRSAKIDLTKLQLPEYPASIAAKQASIAAK